MEKQAWSPIRVRIQRLSFETMGRLCGYSPLRPICATWAGLPFSALTLVCPPVKFYIFIPTQSRGKDLRVLI